MNVAITRAKKLLIIIGDSNTIRNEPFIDFMISKIKEIGVIYKPI